MSLVLFVFLLFCQTVFAAPALLREGSRGEAVRELQKALIELEYMEGKPTGVFDKKTTEAVRRFQRDRELEVDGICGPITRAELKKKDLKKAPEAAGKSGTRGRKEKSGS